MDGMKRKKTRRSAGSRRASVSFPPELYETLQGIARQKRVSVAWVVRDAAEKYVAEKWPLFASDHRQRP
ncbi:MAG: ribbon-helix-helix domain-containing protein [Gammaproteobacteria bacterium]|nr:ribbon-helix-helix domain-containing protein [Gammaproteobacteria bacterium]